MSPLMMDNALSRCLMFKPADLTNHLDLCIRFSMDASLCSFGSVDRFLERAGEGSSRYIDWLRRMTNELPGSVVHVWQGERVVGQIEMSRLADHPEVGYVHLFYLVPELRGRGLGTHLEEYAWTFLGALGCQSLRLSVHPSNTPAWRFYQRRGWQDLGRGEGASGVHLLQKQARPITR